MVRTWPSAVLRTWRQLPHERRLAAGAALALFATLFLPWYQDTVIAKGAAASPLQSFSDSLTGWGAFSFVEAAVLLVAAGVLVLLFIRANGGAFHVPGGDGGVILAAGVWTCVLVLWRIFDKEGSSTTHPQFVTSTGVEWGIFFALGVAGFLAYAGSRIKLVNEPEPPLPGEAPRSRSRSRRPRPVPVPPAPAAAPPRRRGPLPPEPPTLRAGDEPPTITSAEDEPPTIASRADEPPTIASGADEAPTVASTSDEPATRKLTRDDAPPPAGHPRPSRRRVEFPDLDEIEFEDPPTARLGRSAPAGRRRPEDGDGS